MWLSLNTISDMIDIKDLAPEEIALRLTMSSAEIEKVEYMNPFLNTVIAARILDVLPHPNADKLTLCDLDAGGERLRVVCGAPNHKKGDLVALATVGTKFNEEFTVKKTKIRGQESSGMLCSERELGLSDDHSGVMILDAGTRPGTSLASMYPEWVDVRLEIDNKSITHRPDLWSHVGFAREIGALFGRRYTSPVDLSILENLKGQAPFTVTIKSPKGAPRYCGLAVRNIKIAESPSWLKARVTAIGMRPINNIVDLTNYVMAEIGEPMHAFDRTKIRGDQIIVRMADDGEVLVTLDGQEHKLTSEDVVIADRDGSIACAGVMGGGNSEIEDSTSEIVYEAANFNPVNIRKTANRYAMRTEAAIRFEKSLDPELCPAAIARIYALTRQIVPGAEAWGSLVDAYPEKSPRVRIVTSTGFIRRKIGCEIDDGKITGILSSLDFQLSHDGDNLTIDVPSYRATKDVSMADDIVEEVGRVYGYDHIPPQTPLVPCAPPEKNMKRLMEREIKTVLTRDHNFTEVYNYSFVGEELLERLGVNRDEELRLKNPLSIEQDRLRRSLIPLLFSNIVLNQRNQEGFRIFELGRVYLKKSRKDSELAVESTRIAGAVFRKKADQPVFYEAKNAVMDLLAQLRIAGWSAAPAGDSLPSYAHPARALELRLAGSCIGYVFEPHPVVRERFELKGAAALFDLDMDALLSAPRREIEFKELQKFPEVPFEISVLADRLVNAADIQAIVERIGGHVRSAEVISVYEGGTVPGGKKSVSLKVIFAAPEHTLGPDEIERLQKKVIGDLSAKGYTLR